jgi:hypothetical protein
MVEPKFTKLMTLGKSPREPAEILSRTEIAEPARTYDLIDTAEAMVTKSKMLTALPVRAKARRDMVDPNVEQSKQLTMPFMKLRFILAEPLPTLKPEPSRA